MSRTVKKSSKTMNLTQRPTSGYWPSDLQGARLCGDPAFSHYPMPLGYAFEPYTMSVYPSLQPATYNMSFTNGLKKKFNVNDATNLSQDYMSLPQVYCDGVSEKSSDTDRATRRRFSDPGLNQLSQEDETDGSESVCDQENKQILQLREEVTELKETNKRILADLLQMQLKIDNMETAQTQPGDLSSYIGELRTALQVRDEALIDRINRMMDETSSNCNKVHSTWEHSDANLRLKQLEDKCSELALSVKNTRCASNTDTAQKSLDLLLLENEELREKLQSTANQLTEAEASKQKLERLVGILRKKINGVSVECASSTLPASENFSNHPTSLGTKPSPPPKPASISPMAMATRANIKVNGNNTTSTPEKFNELENGKASTHQTLALGLTISGPVTDL